MATAMKVATWKTYAQMENDMKIELKEDKKAWMGLIWHRTRPWGRLL